MLWHILIVSVPCDRVHRGDLLQFCEQGFYAQTIRMMAYVSCVNYVRDLGSLEGCDDVRREHAMCVGEDPDGGADHGLVSFTNLLRMSL